MEKRDTIEIISLTGKKTEVNVVTYLMDEETKQSYIVYTKNEKNDNSYIIYISKIFSNGKDYEIKEISSNDEWLKVQKLLKQIANAK